MTQDEQPEQPELETLLRYLKALADETRLRILGLLAGQPRSVEELAHALDLKAPTVSWHLGKLKELELVEMRAEGNTHVYRLNGKGLGRIHHLLGSPERMSHWVDEDAGTTWERKVIADYIQDGRLKDMPAYRKKREIILRWLAEQLERDRTYSEKEVNAFLGQYYEDVATLRRELVGYKLLQRERGVYWRPPAPALATAEVEPVGGWETRG